MVRQDDKEAEDGSFRETSLSLDVCGGDDDDDDVCEADGAGGNTSGIDDDALGDKDDDRAKCTGWSSLFGLLDSTLHDDVDDDGSGKDGEVDEIASKFCSEDDDDDDVAIANSRRPFAMDGRFPASDFDGDENAKEAAAFTLPDEEIEDDDDGICCRDDDAGISGVEGD